ncbi:MAG TPA: DUF4383 domain-containing protein [Mycobacterium sp.]|jgi:hypothetical protein|nr:DUF4383 domain-containing protein [Mycobacterium sp.]
MAAPQTRQRLAPVQIAAYVVGVAFLIPGVLGFVPGITTHYEMLDFAGHESGAKLLGIFGISVLHNIVHLAFGIAGLVLARSFTGARGYLIGSGVIYLLLTIYGLLIDHESAANFVPIDAADNWLHLVLAVGMLGLGFVFGRRRPA